MDLYLTCLGWHVVSESRGPKRKPTPCHSGNCCVQGRNLAKFDHVRNERQVVSSQELAAQQADPANSLKHMSEDTKRVMAKLNSADSAVVGPPAGCS